MSPPDFSGLAVIIPAFREEESLPSLLSELAAAGFAPEQVIVVNDHSPDRTADIARQAGVVVLDLPVNLGIGGAVQTGYRWAATHGFEFAVQVDGDGQHPPSTLEVLLKEARASNADMVIGSRFKERASEFRSSFLRRVGIRWFSLLIRALTGATVFDTTSGLRMCSRRLFTRFASSYPTDYPEPETTAWALAHGYKVIELGVSMRERQGGSSSITNLRPLYYMAKVTLGILVASFRFSRVN
jgi:glycosyltransferase involved in cell wall biosynthesis